MIRNEFNDKVAADKILNSLQKRLGELITDVVGNDRVQSLFDAAGKHPEQYEGLSTGEIALKEGVITPDTKTALLVAQAAARTLTIAGKAESLRTNMDNLATYYKQSDSLDANKMGYLSLNDDTFKFVGSDRDPEILRQAQGEWMAAQSCLNMSVAEIDDRSTRSDWAHMVEHSAGGPDLFKDSYLDGFKMAAADKLAQAATMLAAEGHASAAKLIDTLSDQVMESVKDHNSPSPLKFLQTREWNIRANIGFKSQFVEMLGMPNGPAGLRPPDGEDRVMDILKGKQAPPPSQPAIGAASLKT